MLRRHHHFMLGFTKTLVQALIRPVVGYLITLSLTIQVLFAVVIHFVERSANPDFVSFLNSCYFVVTVVTGVGLGDLAPVTPFGKAVTMVMMLAGTAIFVSFTAVLSASILEVELEHERQKDQEANED